MNRADFDQLCSDYFDGQIDASSRTALEKELRDSAEARRAFWDAAEWHAALLDWGQQQSGREAARGPIQQPGPTRRPQGRSISSQQRTLPVRKARPHTSPTSSFPKVLFATVLTMILTGVWGLWWHKTRPVATIAVIEQATGTRWSGRELEVGARIKASSLELSAGVAQLRFGDHAQVTVQAPARFRLISPGKMALEAGRVFVEARPGFQVEAPGLKLRDLGTQFGVVASAGGTEAHVFAGRVEVASVTSQFQLASNQAVAARADALVAIPVNREAFPQPYQSIAVSITDPGFEDAALLQIGSFPKLDGYWGGDPARITTAHSAIAPDSGKSMLRLVESIGMTADLWQIVNLQAFRRAIAAGGVVARVSAKFNREASGALPQKVKVRLVSFRGPASNASAAWQQELVTATAPQTLLDDEPSSWQTVSDSLPLPPDSDLLLVSVHGDLNVPGMPAGREVFVDSVELTLHLPLQPATQP